MALRSSTHRPVMRGSASCSRQRPASVPCTQYETPSIALDHLRRAGASSTRSPSEADGNTAPSSRRAQFHPHAAARIAADAQGPELGRGRTHHAHRLRVAVDLAQRGAHRAAQLLQPLVDRERPAELDVEARPAASARRRRRRSASRPARAGRCWGRARAKRGRLMASACSPRRAPPCARASAPILRRRFDTWTSTAAKSSGSAQRFQPLREHALGDHGAGLARQLEQQL